MTTTRRGPIAVLPDGRGVYILSSAEWTALRTTIRGYYTWLESGGEIDPWQTGVATASHYDSIQSKRHKARGGFDAGRCAEPETTNEFMVNWHAMMLRLWPHDRALLYWRIIEKRTPEWCAEKRRESVDTTEARWTWLGVHLHHRLL